MDIQIAPALPSNHALSYEKFPGFQEQLDKIRENEAKSFSVEFPEGFDMSGEYIIKYPNGSQTRHSMASGIGVDAYSALICYHPSQVLEIIARKQVEFYRKEKMRKKKEAQEDAESKRNIEEIKAKLAALDMEDDDEGY